MSGFLKDLIVMVADNDAELTVRALLKRHQALNIRPVDCDLIRHPQRDSGCRAKPEDLLRVYSQTHRKALVLFDHHGSGREALRRNEVETHTRQLLERNGWAGRVEVIVFSPELEIWMWSDSREVDRVLGWQNDPTDLRQWLSEQGLTQEIGAKPGDPKKAYHQAVRKVRRAVSASHFKQIAQSVSMHRCQDPAFQKFKRTLQAWFPVNQRT